MPNADLAAACISQLPPPNMPALLYHTYGLAKRYADKGVPSLSGSWNGKYPRLLQTKNTLLPHLKAFSRSGQGEKGETTSDKQKLDKVATDTTSVGHWVFYRILVNIPSVPPSLLLGVNSRT
ncbi:hypothetical protein GE09DRAFT_1049720 [Coniochaeta sp. 2T2.1]|nr:hypothetical protein GE09DRAFT_1049720 [Coniochaeta sp. 2T2.1]